MKTPSFYLFFLLALCSCQPTTPSADSVIETTVEEITPEEAIQQLVIDAFDQVWSALDTNSLARLHTEDFLLLEHGEVWTNDTIINYQRNAMAGMIEQGYVRTNHMEFLTTGANSELAWTTYHNYGTWTVGKDTTGQAHWLESAVAVKTAEGWKLKMLHSTRVQK
ncbi:nuclear transport factor 2 family protein [Lewinella cohaerens]|uniref:nuclear transport factor 2 family protein n=1 Tax=Lewinella cohaerens TaxID=70995 RepID=UPI00035FDC9B|nr:nuclear transport factor 2 family protein [Lewinella cohaerens]